MSTGKLSSPYQLTNVRSAMGHYLLGRGAGAVAGLVSVVLLVRYMEVRDYAAYTAVMGIAGIVAMLSYFGLERAATRFLPEGRLFEDSHRLAGFIWRLLAIRTLSAALATLILALVWPWAIHLFNFVSINTIPPSLAVFLFANACFSLLSTILQALVLQKRLTQIIVAQWGGRLIWIILLTQHSGNLSLSQALWIMAIPEIGGVALLVIAVASALRAGAVTQMSDIMPIRHWPDWKAVQHLAGHSYFFNVMASLPQGYFIRTLVAATLPIETVAAYGFFSNLVDRLRMYLPIQLMYNLVEPVLVARYIETKDANALIQNVQLMFRVNLIILAAALVFILTGGTRVVEVLTQGKFVEQSWILALLILQISAGSHVLAMQLVFNTLKLNNILSKSGLIALVAMLSYIIGVLHNKEGGLLLFAPLVYEIVVNGVALLFSRCGYVTYKVPISAIVRVVLFMVIGLLVAYASAGKLLFAVRYAEIFDAIVATIFFAVSTLLSGFITKNEFLYGAKLIKFRVGK